MIMIFSFLDQHDNTYCRRPLLDMQFVLSKDVNDKATTSINLLLSYIFRRDYISIITIFLGKVL